MKISVIGAAGVIGSAVAFCLAEKRLAQVVALIDLPGDNLDFQALDLSTGVACAGVKVISGGFEQLEGSDIVVMTASVPLGKVFSRQEMLAANLGLIDEVAREIGKRCPEAVLLQVSNPIEPLSYVMFKQAGLNPEKIIGYTINDTFRYRMLLAERLGIDASRVEAWVIGEHGATQVPVFSQVKVDGNPINVTHDDRQWILSKIPGIFKTLEYYRDKTGRTAAWTTAAGVGSMITSIVTNTRDVFPCSTILGGEYGLDDICLGVPAVLGARGIERIVELPLDPMDQKALDHSANTIRQVIAKAMNLV